MVRYGAVNLYWGRCGRVCSCRSLLGTMTERMTQYISTRDGVVAYGAVYLYWGGCDRLPHCRSLLRKVQ